MYPHPDLSGQLAKDRQRLLLREVEIARQLDLAQMERQALSMRLRQSISALLLRLGHSVQPRRAALARRSEAPGRPVDTVPASASGR